MTREAAVNAERERVKAAEADLATVFDSIRAMQPDDSEEPFDGIAQALVMARAKLEVAQIRLSVADAASGETQG